MKSLILGFSLLASTFAFAAPPQVGEVTSSAGSSTQCCPTGGCAEKMPRCAGVDQSREMNDKRPASQSRVGRGKAVRTERQ